LAAAIEPEPPSDALLAISEKLEAIKRECWRVLLKPELAFCLSQSETAWLGDTLSFLQAINVALPRHLRNYQVENWPVPALPAGVLLGPRDLLPLLNAGASLARIASDYAGREIERRPVAV